MHGLYRVLKSPKTRRYGDKVSLKKINQVKDKGLKINLLMRLLGKRNQEIKHLKMMIRELKHNQSFKRDGLCDCPDPLYMELTGECEKIRCKHLLPTP